MDTMAPMHRPEPRLFAWLTRKNGSSRIAVGVHAAILAALCAGAGLAAVEPKRWTDNDLVTSYRELDSRGELQAAVITPSLPADPPQRAFLDALAWLASGSPSSAGTLTIDKLDGFIRTQAHAYLSLLKAKVERGEDNDFARTLTWKVIQKLTLLRNEMARPENSGRWSFPAISKAPGGDDPWEREHTLGSAEEFRNKVCRASHERPVLVKFGNTNCTQCMLFEMIGSVKDLAESPAIRGVDVYKVWWGYRPDASFAGKIRDPQRLDDLAKAEGVKSSPFFIVYRNGRRYPCGDAFPDGKGADERLDSCLSQTFGEAPVAAVCEGATIPASSSGL